MGDDELIVLGFWASPFVARVRIALEEKGLNYEYKQEDLPNKSPLLLQMNPVYKKVPVLIHNGKPLCESNIIVQYIDEVWSDKAPVLLPSDPYDKSQARFWADYIDKIYDAGGKINWHKNKEGKEEGKKEMLEILKRVEGALGEKPYFGGQNFGYVDIALIGFYPWFHPYGTIGNFSVEAECPKLIAWGKRCAERKSVAKYLADPKACLELALKFRMMMGLE